MEMYINADQWEPAYRIAKECMDAAEVNILCMCVHTHVHVSVCMCSVVCVCPVIVTHNWTVVGMTE